MFINERESSSYISKVYIFKKRGKGEVNCGKVLEIEERKKGIKKGNEKIRGK